MHLPFLLVPHDAGLISSKSPAMVDARRRDATGQSSLLPIYPNPSWAGTREKSAKSAVTAVIISQTLVGSKDDASMSRPLPSFVVMQSVEHAFDCSY